MGGALNSHWGAASLNSTVLKENAMEHEELPTGIKIVIDVIFAVGVAVLGYYMNQGI